MSEASKEKNASHSLLKQIFFKKKIHKQTNQINTDDEKNSDESLGSAKLQEDSNTNNVSVEEKSPEKFKSFIQEIEKFINYIKNNKDLKDYIYKYPQILEKQVNTDVDELQNLLAELTDIVANIKRLKTQKKYVRKEATTVKNLAQRAKDNETRELESHVSRHDREMYARWIKSKWKADALVDLLFDVQEKQLALKNLNKLISRFLESSKDESLSSDKVADGSNDGEKSVSLTSSMFSFQSKTPVPPPLPAITLPKPIPLTVNALNRNNSRLSWAQRRFRAERRGNFSTARAILENRDNESFVFAFNVNNNARNTSADYNFNSFEFDPSRFSCNSIDTNSTRTSTSQINDSSNSDTRQFEDNFEIKSDVQTILQTLIDERSRNTTLMINDSNESCNSEENTEETNFATN